MAPTVLGLDIGGANLKAATPDRRAVSVPFPLWKQPARLPAALAGLVGRLPEADELAVTMTGELCDCFRTKRDGVRAILDAAVAAGRGRAVRVWSTDGRFVTPDEARAEPLKVAAANWHALATFAGRYASDRGGLLVDVGSTTTDLIPLTYGVPSTRGLTDPDRLRHRELVYVGVRRTPVFALVPDRTAAELFATTQDVYVVLGLLPEEPADRDTADGRPLTVEHALARLARVWGGDLECFSDDSVIGLAATVHTRLVELLASSARAAYYAGPNPPELRAVVLSGAGEFLARRVIEAAFPDLATGRIVSLNDELGPKASACGPAYAVAVLASEQRPGVL